MSATTTTPERCARCALPVAAWRVELGGNVYCTAFCSTRDVARGKEKHEHRQSQ